MSGPCACRRGLTESQLFAAHGVGSAPIVEHDIDHNTNEPLTANSVRQRYAREDVRTVLQRLEDTERRLAIGGRS